MKHAVHHIKKRKGTRKIIDGKFIERLDKLLMIMAVIGPSLTIPQIAKIFYYQNAAGLSIITWSLFAVQDIPWIIYGIVHKEKPIIIAYNLWFLTNIAVIVGIMLYG
ncbi:PQ-loop domain-containing transporter [Patescibacteria group bacterium]